MITVMEVASGEHGEAVGTLVTAVNSGKNGNTLMLTENEAGMQLQGVSSLSKNIANDISKADKTQTKMLAIANQTSNDMLTALTKYDKNDTVINIPTNDEINSQNKVLPASEVCTTSLLDSHDSVVTLPNKNTFPTSGSRQFWILLKRAFKTIVRDKQLMHMRLASHVIVGAIIGMIYYDIGNDASKVMSNAGCIFFTSLFTMFTGMMPTILTCKCSTRCMYTQLQSGAYASGAPNAPTHKIGKFLFCLGFPFGVAWAFNSLKIFFSVFFPASLCSSTRDGRIRAGASELLVFAQIILLRKDVGRFAIPSELHTISTHVCISHSGRPSTHNGTGTHTRTARMPSAATHNLISIDCALFVAVSVFKRLRNRCVLSDVTANGMATHIHVRVHMCIDVAGRTEFGFANRRRNECGVGRILGTSGKHTHRFVFRILRKFQHYTGLFEMVDVGQLRSVWLRRYVSGNEFAHGGGHSFTRESLFVCRCNGCNIWRPTKTRMYNHLLPLSRSEKIPRRTVDG